MENSATRRGIAWVPVRNEPAHAEGPPEEILHGFRRGREGIRRIFQACASGRRDRATA